MVYIQQFQGGEDIEGGQGVFSLTRRFILIMEPILFQSFFNYPRIKFTERPFDLIKHFSDLGRKVFHPEMFRVTSITF